MVLIAPFTRAPVRRDGGSGGIMRAIGTLAGALLAVLLVASPSAAGASRVELVGPDGNLHCGTGEVTAGQPGGFGFAVIHQRDDEVVAVVHLRGGEPSETYQVRLVQISEDQADCHFGAMEVVANRAGHLVARLSEPVNPATTGFTVAVNTGTVFGAPHWVAARTVDRT